MAGLINNLGHQCKTRGQARRLDKALEEGLEGTFPASDAVAGSVLSGWLSGGQTC